MSPDALVIVARAPERGRVKSRLAASVGEARALSIYRALGERIVAGVQGAARRVVVSHTPADAGTLMRDWLGADLEYEPQCEGDLGARMAGAIAARLLEGARRVVVIGADCPTVDARTIRDAFAALDEADVVLGPAHDGGYYLIGMRASHPALFERIPWSTASVLALTLQRINASGLSVRLLAPMRDVDTIEDWLATEASLRG